jgi:hypothetical protein
VVKIQDDEMITRHLRDGDGTVPKFSNFLFFSLLVLVTNPSVTRNPEMTINAVYAIDPKNNGGKSYQYDEVVRKKDQRRRMHGGDCECCREVNRSCYFVKLVANILKQYYNNVGPLPNRLRQPLWRSPSRNQSKSDALDDSLHGNSGTLRRQADIDSHQQAISRHRHTWARAKTPPGYWEIGFPNTQEVGDINEKAKEMQKKKKIQIEHESNRNGGRYRKK